MTDILTREITHVDELNGVFRVRFDYIKEWRDHNLKFKDLHENIVNAVRHSSLNTSYYLMRLIIMTMKNSFIELFYQLVQQTRVRFGFPTQSSSILKAKKKSKSRTRKKFSKSFLTLTTISYFLMR